MNFIKKFYNAENGTEGGAATSAEPAKEEMSVAAAMAKFGKKSDENSTAPKPIDINAKAEVKTEPTPAATAKVEETVKTEPEATKTPPTEEPKKTEPAPIAQPVTKAPTLEEVLKKEQPNTILKALGLSDDKIGLMESIKEVDPKVVGIIQAYHNGTLADYVNALGTDYTKMSDVDVMRNQLRKEYPTVSEAAFQALFEDEVLDKYKLDDTTYSEAEVSKGKLLLEAKAAKYRNELIDNQEKFLMPAKPEPKKEQPAPDSGELQQKQIEAYRKELSEAPLVKEIFANKKIAVGEGDEKFTFPVEPESIIDALTDMNKWTSLMYDKDGDMYVPKIETQMLVSAFAHDPILFLSEYAKHLKSLGSKAVADPIENASPAPGTTPAKADVPFTSAAEAMAKKGRRVDPVGI